MAALWAWKQAVPEIIDPVFAKTSQYARFLLSENERFGLVFVKTGLINSGTDLILYEVPVFEDYPPICARIYKGVVFILKTSWKRSFLKTNVFSKR
jgi:hypothetical protein